MMHVPAGTEPAARPRDHQHVHVACRGDVVECRDQLLAHVVGERVQLVGPVERDARHARIDVEADGLGHAAASLTYRAGPRSRPDGRAGNASATRPRQRIRAPPLAIAFQ